LATVGKLTPRLATSITVGGASPGVLLHQAAMALASDQADVIVIATGENRATGVSRDDAIERLTAVGHPAFENPYGPLIPAFYAMAAARYFHEYGVDRDALAHVAVTARMHAVMHPDSPMDKLLTVQEVLESKPIADPLRLFDCCLISDAAGALVVTRPERAPDLPHKAVYLRGVGQSHTHEHMIMAPDDLALGARQSGERAFAMAEMKPSDVDFAELYARYDGRFPINTHGGLLSYAQAGASGGMHGIVEAVRQIRGEAGDRQVSNNAVGLVHNEGGVLSSHCTIILSA
jgi:acetyl-CoA acetyltransferase